MDLVVKVNGGEYRLGDIIIPEIRKQVSDGGMIMIGREH